MSRKVSTEEFAAILDVVEQFPEGVTIAQISAALDTNLSRRSLQRRLAKLIEDGKLEVSGQRGGARYKTPDIKAELPLKQQATQRADYQESYITISPRGEEIKHYVRQTIQQRKPVGYKRDFLEEYIPNHTTYLPLSLRKHLHKIGNNHDGSLPAGTFARKILNNFLIDLSWNSSRFEGNTYSLLETERLLEFGDVADGKAAFETQMIINHKDAIEFLIESAEEMSFNRYTILNLHALLSNNLLANPKSCGKLRTIAVGISKTVYHPLEVPQLVEDYFQQILDKANVISDPFEQAFFVMVHFPYLQAFEDVNKRVSRLAANIPLIKHNLCPLSFVDVPNRAYIDGILGVYELNQVELLRDIFVWAYERSAGRYSATRESLGKPDPFRMRYRKMIASLVSEIVQKKLNKQAATKHIQHWASLQIRIEDQVRFIEVVETELLGLHEGNIARYSLRPSEFESWHKLW